MGFGEGRHIFIAQPQVQGHILGYAPVVLNEEVIRVGAELVIDGAELNRGLLREPQQEVGKSQTGMELPIAADAAGGQAIEGKCASRVGRIAYINELAPEVGAPAPAVLTM